MRETRSVASSKQNTHFRLAPDEKTERNKIIRTAPPPSLAGCSLLTLGEAQAVDADETNGVGEDVLHAVAQPLQEVAAPPARLREASNHLDDQRHHRRHRRCLAQGPGRDGKKSGEGDSGVAVSALEGEFGASTSRAKAPKTRLVYTTEEEHMAQSTPRTAPRDGRYTPLGERALGLPAGDERLLPTPRSMKEVGWYSILIYPTCGEDTSAGSQVCQRTRDMYAWKNTNYLVVYLSRASTLVDSPQRPVRRPVEAVPHGGCVPGGEPPRGHRPIHGRGDHVLEHRRHPDKAGEPEEDQPPGRGASVVAARRVVRQDLAVALTVEAAHPRGGRRRGHVAAGRGGVHGAVGGRNGPERGYGTPRGERPKREPQHLHSAHEKGGAEGPRHGPDR